MKLLKGDSFPIFLISDGVSQQSCRGHLSKEVARSSGCRRSVQRFRCSMAVFELLARATGAWVVAAGNGHLVNRSEGLVSKRRDRPYQAGRSKHWVKIKNRKPSGNGSGDGCVRII